MFHDFIRTSTIVALMLFCCSPLLADENDQIERIKQVAAQSKLARTGSDYTALVDTCNAILEEEIANEKHRHYINDLSAWALNRRGRIRSELAATLREIHNDEQAEKAQANALLDFDTAISRNVKCWRAYSNRAALRTDQKLFSQAVTDFSTVIDLHPDSLDVWFNRAELHYELQSYEAALGDYDHVLSESAGDLQATTGRAHCLCQLGRFDEALIEYNVVVELKPRSGWALANRADLHQERGDWKLAHADYNQALAVEPVGGIYQRMAWLLATNPSDDLFMPTVALSLIQKAIHLDGENSTYLDTLAAAYAANGEFERAQQTQARAIESHPSATPESLTARQALYLKDEIYEQGKTLR